jgi:hypothetical protein
MQSKRNLCAVFMIQGRELKNRRARNIGIRMGIGQENHCEMLFPRGFQESSNSLLHFSNCSLRGAATGGPAELDSSGCCENDQMSTGPPKSQWRGLKILKENKIPWFNRNCDWVGRIWSACSLRSSLRKLR